MTFLPNYYFDVNDPFLCLSMLKFLPQWPVPKRNRFDVEKFNSSCKVSRIQQSMSQKPKQFSKQLWREDSWTSTLYFNRHLWMNSSSKQKGRQKKFHYKKTSPTNLLSGGETITLIVPYLLLRYLEFIILGYALWHTWSLY